MAMIPRVFEVPVLSIVDRGIVRGAEVTGDAVGAASEMNEALTLLLFVALLSAK